MEYQQIYTRYTIQGTHTLHCLMQEIMPATDHLHHMPLFTGTPPAAATLARDFHRVTAIASITASVPYYLMAILPPSSSCPSSTPAIPKKSQNNHCEKVHEYG